MRLRRMRTLLTEIALASAVLAVFAGGITGNLGGNVLAQLFTPTAKQTVLVLVNEGLYQETQQFGGMASQYSDLSNTTIKARIDRYANAIQQDLPLTKTVILPVPSVATVKAIHDQIANFALFESEEIEGKLNGVILVGDVPLPMVSNGGNEFASMYPYTDFLAPRFSWDEGQTKFVYSQNTHQPELWHGVIKFDDTADYAAYFDKNFLARRQHADFVADGQNLFVADLPEEEVSLNEDLAQTYANYLSISKDRVYNRYTKELLQSLQSAFASTLKTNSTDADVVTAFDKLQDNIGNSVVTGQIPDVLVKGQIDKVAKPVSALFQSYLNRVITALEQTGRYDFSLGEIENPIKQIALVDAYQEKYFKALNDELAKKVDVLAKAAAKPAALFSNLTISGNITLSNGQQQAISSQTFVNQRTKSALDNTLVINSTEASQIEGAYECRVYRGSEEGKMVETIRDMQVPEADNKCYLPWEAGAAARFREDPLGCNPFYALNVKDLHRTSLVTDVFNSATTHEACYELRTPANYLAAVQKSVDPSVAEDPRAMVLATVGSQRITLADVILAIDSETNLADRNRWSAMFANLPNNKLTINRPFGAAGNVQSINLTTSKTGTVKAVDSLVYHKDPTPDLLNQQLQDNVSKDLPVDQVRYLSFLNAEGQTEKVDYPDLFNAGSYSQLLSNLRRMETRFTELTGSSQRGELTAVINEAANKVVLENVINWSNSDLNRKYQQVLQLQLTGQEAWGDLLPQVRYEAAILNLNFDEEVLATDFPAVGKTDIGGFAVTKPEEQELPAAPPIIIDQDKLNATTACGQYYNANKTAAQVLKYLNYLDCWAEKEILGTVNEFANYPAKFLPVESSVLPTRNQALKAIEIIPQQKVIAVVADVADAPFKVQLTLINTKDQRLIGKAVTVNVKLTGPAKFADGSKEKDIYMATGQELTELTLTGEMGAVGITATAETVTATAQFEVEAPYTLALLPTKIAAGSNTTVRLQLTKSQSNQVWPRSIRVDDQGALGLGDEFLVADGSVNLPVVVPKQAGVYPLAVALPNGQGEQLSLSVTAGAPVRLLLNDRKSKSVSRFENEIALVAVDQYGNQLNSDFSGTASIIEGTDMLELTAASFTADKGLVKLPFTFKAIGNVGLSLSVNGQALPINFLLTENLTKEQISNWQINSLYLDFRHNEANLDQALVENWLKKGIVQTIATQPSLAIDANIEPLLKVSGANLIGLSHLKEMPEQELIFGDPTFSLVQNTKENVFDFSADIGELIATTTDPITQLAAINSEVAIGTQTGDILQLSANNQKMISNMPLGVKALAWWQPEASAAPVLLAVTKESCSKLKGCLFAFEFDADGKLIRSPLKLNYQDKINKLFVVDLTQDGHDDLLLLDAVDDLLLFPNVEANGKRVLSKNPTRIANTGTVVDSRTDLSEYFTHDANLQRSTITVRDQNGGSLRAGDKLEYNVTLRTNGAAFTGQKLNLPLGSQYEVLTDSLTCTGCRLERSDNAQYSYAITGLTVPANGSISFSFTAIVKTVESSNAQVQIVMDADGYPADGKPDILIVVPGTDLQTYYYSAKNAQGNIIYLPYQEGVNPPTITGERSNAQVLTEQATNNYDNYLHGDTDGNGVLDSIQTVSSGVLDFTKDVGDYIENIFCSRGCLAIPVNYAFLVDGITAPFQAVPVLGLTLPPVITLYGPAALAPVTIYRLYISPTLTGETAMAHCYGIYPAGFCSVNRFIGLDSFGDICENINHAVVDLLNGAVDIAQNGLDEINAETGRVGVKINLKPSGKNAPPGVAVKTNVKVPGFPSVLTNWLSAQMHEILNVLDLPDIHIIYPDFTTYFDSNTKEEVKKEAAKPPVEVPVDPAFESDIPGLATAVNSLTDIAAGVQSFEGSIQKAEDQLSSINDFFADISSNALLDINEEVIPIQYPYMTPQEIVEFQTRLIKWYADTKKEVGVAWASWGCFGGALGDLGDINLDDFTSLNNTLIDGGQFEKIMRESEDEKSRACVSLLVAWGGLSGTVNTNIEILDDYLNLPYVIFEVENFEAKYAGAIVGYMDQFDKHVVQWLNNNTERIKSWQKMLVELRSLWKDISFLVNISLDYSKQCNDCRSHRFSNLQLLLELFIQIPDPPVIALPRLPDITLDLSDVQAGITLDVPKFDFQAVPVELPNLPKVTLPAAPPINFSARLPEFGFLLGIKLPEAPNFDDLLAVLDLPNLPDLTLPRLPLIPLPPDLGDYAASFTAQIKVYLEIVSEVLRIACILEKGLLPTIPEFALKEQIEALTARPLTPVLPIDVAAGIGFELPELPTFNYLKEIRVIGHTYLHIDVSIFMDLIKGLSNKINTFTTNFTTSWADQIKELNKNSTDLLNLDFDIKAIDVELKPEEEAIMKDLDLDFSQPEARVNRLLAQNQNDQEQLTAAPTQENPITLEPEPGLYVSDPATGTVNKLIDYVPADFANTVMAFLKFDDDNDEDILYSIGNELYLKANQSKVAKTEHVSARPTVLQWQEPTPPKMVSFTKGSDTVRVNVPELAEDDVLVLELAPTGLTDQTITATYVLTTATLPDALVGDFKATVSDWQEYTGNKRSLNFGDAKVAKVQASALFWQQARPTVSMPITVGEITLTWRLIKADKISSAIQTVTFSNLQCSDDTLPQVNLGAQNNKNIDVIVYQPIEINATNSSDNAGSVIGYFIDRNLTVDSNNDGNPRNDRDLTGDADPEVDTDFDGNPANDPSVGSFRLQAYDKVGSHLIGVGVIDEAGNEQIEEITINVTLPQITISQVTANSISGYITPAVPNIPLELVRKRAGQVEVIANMDSESQLKTDRSGRFVLDNLESTDIVVVKDQNGDVIAEINNQTGNIGTANGATVKVETEADDNGTRLVIVDKNGNYVTSVIKRTNGLNDVIQITDEKELNDLPAEFVVVQDLEQNDDYVWELLSGADSGFPGAAVLVNKGRQALVTPVGQIYLMKTTLTLEVPRIRDLTDPQWIVIKDGRKALARILISTGNKVQFKEPAASNVTTSRPRVAPTFAPLSPFADLSLDDPDFDILNYLYQTHVIEGRVQDGVRRADLDKQMTRAEFTKTLLAMLCIEPRESAKKLPAVFADISTLANGQLPWYYSYIKESFIRGFVTGYKGQIDPVTGLPIFLPQNNISRAEAAKVILEVLEAQGTVDLSGVETAEVWYVPFMKAAQKYDIITAEEAQTPDRSLTRREFFQMVDRVLKLNNCLEKDDDRNGLPQYFENEFDVIDPSDDPDGDGLTNLQEFRHGTDPLDPDTDDGGINDGVEVGRGTNPLDGNDDLPSTLGPTAGVYVEDIVCLQCPCPYTVDFASTLVTNDQIFAIIKGRDGKIITESNTVTYTK